MAANVRGKAASCFVAALMADGPMLTFVHAALGNEQSKAVNTQENVQFDNGIVDVEVRKHGEFSMVKEEADKDAASVKGKGRDGVSDVWKKRAVDAKNKILKPMVEEGDSMMSLAEIHHQQRQEGQEQMKSKASEESGTGSKAELGAEEGKEKPLNAISAALMETWAGDTEAVGNSWRSCVKADCPRGFDEYLLTFNSPGVSNVMELQYRSGANAYSNITVSSKDANWPWNEDHFSRTACCKSFPAQSRKPFCPPGFYTVDDFGQLTHTLGDTIFTHVSGNCQVLPFCRFRNNKLTQFLAYDTDEQKIKWVSESSEQSEYEQTRDYTHRYQTVSASNAVQGSCWTDKS